MHGHFELELGAQFKLESGGQYHWNLHLDYKTRKENGVKIDDRQLRKHKMDVFRLVLLVTPEDNFEITPSIKTDIANFAEAVKNDLPDKQVFKEMGAGNINVQELFNILIKAFNLKQDKFFR